MLTVAQRKPTFRERYTDAPLAAVRDAIMGALAPVTQRVHKGYDSELDDAATRFRIKSGASDRIGCGFH